MSDTAVYRLHLLLLGIGHGKEASGAEGKNLLQFFLYFPHAQFPTSPSPHFSIDRSLSNMLQREFDKLQ